jgi:putative IMPACT (imprinted ancient) family translation regulator
MSAVTRPAEASFTEQRSRFYALLFPLRDESELEAVLKVQRKQHRKAVHHCWAVRLRDAAGQLVEKSKDDGEVGHPGRVLLELLRKHDLEGGLVVSRIFGGVKLGVGGVARAFRETGSLVVEEYLHPGGR